MSPSDFERLLRSLVSLPHEAEWVEFKHNNSAPVEIGEYLSALANSAALHGKPRGYLAWGVEDGGRALVGTSFRPRATKIGNEELENWLAHQLRPPIHFLIHESEIEGRRFVMFEVPPAFAYTSPFSRIRVYSSRID